MEETPLRKTLKDFGTLERLQEQLQECRTVEDLALAVRDAGWLIRWITQLTEGAVRDVLFYDEARETPGFPLYETELRFKQALAKTPMPHPGREEVPVCGKLTYDQARALAAALDTLSSTWWSVVAASKELGAPPA